MRRPDKYYMLQALELAKKAEGRTSPNPAVGCIIVKGGSIIAKGFHRKAGLPHAEVEALRKSSSPKGATMYVTLEPCCHFGKTPPCTDEIIKRGIGKVIIAIKDPHDINNGKGIRALKKSGIVVKVGVCKNEAAKFYRPYAKFITERAPFITAKIAESLDGKIATRTGESRWISNSLSRRYVRQLRSRVDAVMVGINTALKDDPLLLPKTDGHSSITRIVVDSKLRISLTSQLVKTAGQSPLVIATLRSAPAKKRRILTNKGVTVVLLPPVCGRVDLRKLLKCLSGMGIMHILVEGGGELVGGLLDEDLIDRIIFFISPKIIGGRGAVSSVAGRGVASLKEAANLRNTEIRMLEDNILVEADVYRDN